MIDNDAFKLLLNNLFHLNPDDIANILCTTFNKMMVLIVTLADKHQACPYCGRTFYKRYAGINILSDNFSIGVHDI